MPASNTTTTKNESVNKTSNKSGQVTTTTILKKTKPGNANESISSPTVSTVESQTNGSSPTEAKPAEKSEINILHEYAFRLKKTVTFELVSESGPPHAKTFRVKCSFGTKPAETSETTTTATETESTNSSYFELFGEGPSKKAANKNAAKSMIKIIEEKFEPLLSVAAAAASQTNKKKRATSTSNNQRQATNEEGTTKRRPRTQISKVKKTSPEYGKGSINPISRLIQIQQAKNEPEPVFELISSTNKVTSQQPAALTNGKPPRHHENGRRTEFIMQVSLKPTPTSEPIKCEGKGPTKKAAKQNAAETALLKLGYHPKANLKPALKNTSGVEAVAAVSEVVVVAAVSPTTTTTTTSSDTATPMSTPAMTPATADEKGEKRVKFSEEDLVVTLDPAKSVEPGTTTNTSTSS